MNISLDEIKSKAPKGATHIDRVGYFLMKTSDGYLIYSKLGYGWSDKPMILSESEIELYGIKPLN